MVQPLTLSADLSQQVLRPFAVGEGAPGMHHAAAAALKWQRQCGVDGGGGGPNRARVRVVHAAPGVAAQVVVQLALAILGRFGVAKAVTQLAQQVVKPHAGLRVLGEQGG